MAGRSGKGIVLAAVIWIVILGILAVAAKFLILPYFQKELVSETGSRSRYEHDLVLAADSFSGYCVLRSPDMTRDLARQGIRLRIQDDQADYSARMNALNKKDIQMAVFTLDSFITAGAKINAYPATIVMIIDETKGADAMVSYTAAVPDLESLNHPDARIVLTPNSPSEFLARTVIAHFNLPNLPQTWWEAADGSGDVFNRFTAADHSARRAYVMWEPFVSRALDQPGVHVLLDSGKLQGYIVDVLVAERSFLKDHPDVVQAVVESYFRTQFNLESTAGGWIGLVTADASEFGAQTLSRDQAQRMIKGIAWKNTVENYGHFGLLTDPSGSQHIEDMIANITDVLIKTGTLDRDPVTDRAHTLFYANTLAAMKNGGYHPGKALNIIEGLGPGSDELGTVRTAARLRALSDSEWEQLVPVGRMRVKPIHFARGTARLNVQSERDLEALARNLAGWPSYYLKVVGHARPEGDAAANLKLAEERARTAGDTLIDHGVYPERIHVSASIPDAPQPGAQSVSFILGQLPY